jgi:hypothetical protein
MIIQYFILGFLLWNLTFGLKRGNVLHCGLVGWSGPNGPNPEKIKLLMIWNAWERGKDSTGIYTPSLGVKKGITDARYWMSDLADVKDNIFIGHLRAASIGWITKENAHPFHEGKIILAHNGTLENHHKLADELNLDDLQWNVDSHVLTYGMAMLPNHEILNKFLGAAALLWTDTDNPNILYVFRNNERPLFRGNADNGMYFSSIKESLYAVGCTNVKEIKENNVYVINKGKIEFRKTTTPAIKPVKVVTYCPTDIASSLLKGRWIQKDYRDHTWDNNVFLDIKAKQWYFCLGDSQPFERHMMRIQTDKGYLVNVSKYLFELATWQIEEKDFCFIIGRPLLYNNTSRKFANVGDLVHVKSKIDDITFTVRNVRNNEIGVITVSDMRKATYLETKSYLSSLERKQNNEDKQNCKIKRITRNIKFTKEMKELINAVLGEIDDELTNLKELKKDGKDITDSVKRLETIIEKNTFSMEELAEA